MDELATNLLATLKKPSATIDSKIQLFNTFKSNIKHERLPESAQANAVECIRMAIASQISSQLVSTGFSTLGHLVKRLTLQGQMSVLYTKRADLLPVLLERLGDQKEQHRSAALQAFCDLWSASPADVEKIIREGAILGSNARAKEAGMQWVTRVHFEQGLQFKTFVAPMVACLEDADGVIRESAKTNLVELFRNARDAAKADLKRQLTAHNVRKSIATFILSQLQIPAQAVETAPASAPVSAAPRSETPLLFDNSSLLEAAHPPPGSMPPSQETTNIEPYYVHTQRDLEDEFRQMAPAFEGKESEDNWKPRDAHVLKIRRLLKGNAFEEHPIAFVAGIKSLLDGILKVVKSLRTIMSVNGCQCVQELARTLGPSLDPMVEIILQGLDPLCASTKSINAQNGNATITAILSNVSYNIRLMQHVWNACNDKNTQPRTFAAGWLKTIMKAQSNHRSHFEHSGGVDLAEKCIKKGLADSQPKVRESMRSAYWAFTQIWAERGATIMATLDAKSKTALEKDPSNPDGPAAGRAGSTNFTSSVGPGAASNPRAAAPRATLKDQIAAQKRAALAAKKIPDRPNSAMSAFASPIKQAPPATRGPTGLSHTRTASNMSSNGPTRPGAAANNASASASGQNSLMSGPIRRPRRPDVPRPATADPYANRRVVNIETPNESPVGSPRHAAGRMPRPNTQSSHVKSKSTTTARMLDSGRTSQAGSPKISPIRVKESLVDTHFHSHLPRASFGHSSPIATRDESLTMVLPEGHASRRSPAVARHRNSVIDRPGSRDSIGLATPTDGHDEFESTSAMASTPQTQSNKAMSPSRREGSAVSGHHRTQSNDIFRGISEEPQLSGHHNKHSRGQALSPQKVTAPPIRNGNQMDVYEDPRVDSSEPSSATEEHDVVVLEELPLNEQMQQAQPGRSPSSDQPSPPASGHERRLSSTKKPVTTYNDRCQDQNEVLKTRRLLSSGTEKIRSKQLDAHGFRRLQDLVKSQAQNPELQFADLLQALLEYIQTPDDELKANKASRAHGLKLQALGTARAILVLQKSNDDVRRLFSPALCAMIVAKSASSELGTHMSSDLDKAIDETVQNVDDKSEECLDAVCSLAETEGGGGQLDSHRLVPFALKALSKLVQHSRASNQQVTLQRRRRLGTLAVRFLGDSDSDVRKADTEFCIELYQLFGDSNKREFWSLLETAPESQQNLVAYYITRKGKSKS